MVNAHNKQSVALSLRSNICTETKVNTTSTYNHMEVNNIYSVDISFLHQNALAPYTTARLLATSFLGMDAWIASQVNVTLIRKICAWVIFETCYQRVLLHTRHWQTTGRLLQELNVFNVVHSSTHCISVLIMQVSIFARNGIE